MGVEGTAVNYLMPTGPHGSVYVNVNDFLLLLERTRRSEDLSAEQADGINIAITLLEEGARGAIMDAQRNQRFIT